MITYIRQSRALFAASMIGLGVTGLVNGDFALAWQQIPLEHLPSRTFIAYVCAMVELATGIGLLLGPARIHSSRILFMYLLLWLVLLKLPVLLTAPQVQESWAGFGEIGIIAAGGWCLFASSPGAWEKQHLKYIVGAGGIRAARFLLIVCLPMIGLDVLVHTYTLPPWMRWLPLQTDWIYLSGVGSIAASLGMVFGVFPRLAASLEAAMLGVITMIFWAPDLHTGRTATTAFLISAAITSGVWVVADTYRNVPWFTCGRSSRGVTME
jgi:uncharacterized membrane protein YphA (DoxX/SURF4 family)